MKRTMVVAMALVAAGPGAADPLVDLAADYVERALQDVAESVEAIGAEYAAAMAGAAPANAEAVAAWTARETREGDTVRYRTWEGDGPEPAYQAAALGIYRYGAGELTPDLATELVAFEDMTPVLRSAFESFDYSWVYLTGSNGQMTIYPYLPLAKAVHNYPPTDQVYYTAADFENRAVGWTEPYLDLVGAGMMVTASYPVFDGDAVVGVASRDVTLRDLSADILADLAEASGDLAALVDGRGLAIAVSDPELQSEIDEVNDEAGAAALFYRDAPAVAEIGGGARASAAAWVNVIVDRVIGGETDFTEGGRTVLSAEVPVTGWRIVLAGEAE